MYQDQIIAAGRKFLGESKRVVGHSLDTGLASGEVLVDHASDAAQHGYDKTRHLVSSLVEEAPVAIVYVAEQARKLGSRSDARIRRHLGQNGPLIVLAGGVALVGLGVAATLLYQRKKARENAKTAKRRAKASAASTTPAAKSIASAKSHTNGAAKPVAKTKNTDSHA